MREQARAFRPYLEFFWVFTWRNVRLQYNSFVLGLFWGILHPILMSAIFYVALGNSVGTNFSHYFLYIYSGFACWSVFSGSLSQAYLCFLQNDGIVKQIYFPRFMLPLTFLSAKFIDLTIAMGILVVILLNSDLGIHFGWFVLYSSLGIAQLLLISAGFSLLFSVICVRFRGFQVIYPFVAQAIFFTSSVIYDTTYSIDIEWLKPLFVLNPMSIILSTFRSGIFYQEAQISHLLYHSAYATTIYLLGYWWFKREDKFLIDRL